LQGGAQGTNLGLAPWGGLAGRPPSPCHGRAITIESCRITTVSATRQAALPMTPPDRSRRSFLKTSVALAGTSPFLEGRLEARAGETARPLLAYVGTFSSPLRDVLPTQVDLPPGNGRGIHVFQVNRATGAMTPAGVHEMGTSPSCLALNAA